MANTEIAKNAPIRICDGELISGAATLGLAISHLIPATYKGAQVFMSVSHLTINFEKTLKKGINSLDAEIKARFCDKGLTEYQRDFLHSAENCIAAMRIWHSRYLEALEDMPEYKANLENLRRVPFEPARFRADIWRPTR